MTEGKRAANRSGVENDAADADSCIADSGLNGADPDWHAVAADSQ